MPKLRRPRCVARRAAVRLASRELSERRASSSAAVTAVIVRPAAWRCSSPRALSTSGSSGIAADAALLPACRGGGEKGPRGDTGPLTMAQDMNSRAKSTRRRASLAPAHCAALAARGRHVGSCARRNNCSWQCRAPNRAQPHRGCSRGGVRACHRVRGAHSGHGRRAPLQRSMLGGGLASFGATTCR